MNPMGALSPIGVVHSPYDQPSAVPAPPDPAVICVVEVFEEWAPGLLHLDQFSHIYLFSRLHFITEPALLVTPPRETQAHGVFATRSQRRPNPIGMSLVRLIKCEDRLLQVSGCDLVDKTPVLDIKPYWPETLTGEPRFGWFGKRARREGRIVGS